MTVPNWNFSVKWVGDEHIVITNTNTQTDKENETILTVKEYAELMQLLQEFNIMFRNKIDQKLVEWYYKDE